MHMPILKGKALYKAMTRCHRFNIYMFLLLESSGVLHGFYRNGRMAPYGAEAWDCGFVRREFPESRLRQEGGASERNGVKMSSEWQENVALAKGA